MMANSYQSPYRIFSLNHLIEAFVKESLKFQLFYLYRNKEFSIVQLTTKFMISESSFFERLKNSINC